MTTTRKPKKGNPVFKVISSRRLKAHYVVGELKVFIFRTRHQAKEICAALNAYAARDQKSK